MHLKTPITVYMCFRHQDTFKNVFFCPVSLVWCCGDLICSQIQLPARASSQPVLWQGSCLQAFPALLLLLQVSAHAGLCTLPSLPLLSQHPLGSWQSQGFPQQHKDSADNACRLEWGHEKPVPILLYWTEAVTGTKPSPTRSFAIKFWNSYWSFWFRLFLKF